MVRPTILLTLAAVLLLGAACSKSTTTTTNTEVTNIAATNTAVTNTTIPTNTNVVANTSTVTNTVVSMTRNGFEPSSLTIKSGDTVTFVNNDTRTRQPASDPHPSHSGLAGFDAEDGVPPGGQYQFTFTRTGIFGFHDHLFSSLKGTVTVQP
jgi:plastocyanin